MGGLIILRAQPFLWFIERILFVIFKLLRWSRNTTGGFPIALGGHLHLNIGLNPPTVSSASQKQYCCNNRSDRDYTSFFLIPLVSILFFKNLFINSVIFPYIHHYPYWDQVFL